MEAFEQFVAVALEAEGGLGSDAGLVVSSAVKFPVRRQTKKTGHQEFQEHGYEVDLVGARSDKLVLATVKSFFGSRGVVADDVKGDMPHSGGYRLLNEEDIRLGVLDAAAKRYGYTKSQVFFRLYLGKFATTKAANERARIEEWCREVGVVGGGIIEVFGVEDVVKTVREVAARKTYIDNPSIVSIKVLEAAHQLLPPG